MQDQPNFAELIEKAQSVSTDVAGPFDGNNAARVGFQPGRAPGVPAFAYEAKVAVLALPADSAEYEEILNMQLQGEAIPRYEEKTFTKDGDFMVAICYLVPRAPRREDAPVGDAGDREPVAQHERLA